MTSHCSQFIAKNDRPVDSVRKGEKIQSRIISPSPKSKPALCPFSNDNLPMQVSMSSAFYIIILLSIQPHPSRLQIPTGPVGKRPRPVELDDPVHDRQSQIGPLARFSGRKIGIEN
jgi:hypothetical protein